MELAETNKPKEYAGACVFLPLFLALCFLAVFSNPGRTAQVTANPYRILWQHYQAIGGLKRLESIQTACTSGAVTHDGLSGTFRLWERYPAKYRLEEDFSVVRMIQGDDGNTAWRKDPNGKVTLIRDEESRKRREIQRRLENFEHMDPDSDFFTLTLDQSRPVDGHPCHVIQIRNRINTDVLWYFIDARSFMLLQSIDQQPDIRIQTRYSDFREENGILFPGREESDIHPRGKKVIRRIQQQQINIPIPPDRFQVPEDRPGDYRFLHGDRSENIPFQFIENLIYLTVRIGNQTGLWLVDSGASMSLIDRDYALQLGLTPQGTIKGFGFGDTFELSFVRLPRFEIKGAAFSAQTLFCYNGLSQHLSAPACRGILGFDFLSRFVVRIDYSTRTMSLFSPGTFSYRGSGAVLNAPLIDNTFTVQATVDDRYTGKWSLDLGAFNTSFHFPFARANRLDLRPGVQRYSRGLGGEYLEKTIRFDSLRIGRHLIPNPRIALPLEKGVGITASAERIGNIGNSILRRFRIYLDYNRQQVILEKGTDFLTAFPEDGSGMQIAESETGEPIVAFISPGSPAEESGLQAGDRIVKIEPLAAGTRIDLDEIRVQLRRKPGTVLRITIRRQGRSQTLSLPLENLFPAPFPPPPSS